MFLKTWEKWFWGVIIFIAVITFSYLELMLIGLYLEMRNNQYINFNAKMTKAKKRKAKKAKKDRKAKKARRGKK